MRLQAMLRELSVENFAIIERLRLELEPGLNVLTGETGAGKSILIDAVEVALGGRASAEYIRAGAERAAVEVVFEMDSSSPVWPVLERLGIDVGDDGLLVLTREVSRGGRNTGRVNGRVVSVGMLRELTQHLVDLHGQHEHQSLLRPERHLDFLDAYGGQEVMELRRRVEQLHARRRQLQAELQALAGDEAQRERHLDLLRFQIREIADANLRPEEEAELAEARRILGSVEKLRETVGQAYTLLCEGGADGSGLADGLGRVLAAVGEASRIDPALGPARDALEGMGYQLRDLARDLRRYLEGLASDPVRLEEIERRIDFLNTLKRKYGPTLEDVLAFARQAAAELARIEGGEAAAREMERELAGVRAELGEVAAVLSTLRACVARELETRVETELRDLGMDPVCFRVTLEQEEDDGGVPVGDTLLACGPRGVDRVEFLFSPNPGEPPRPLARIASGGELSRVMLALKAIVAEADAVPTVIFDEVDSGVGGSAAAAVGQKLSLVAARRQVLCVTHLAPIGCLADAHFLITKAVRGGRTVTAVERLCFADRVREIARMLAGSQLSELTLRHAEEMLQAAVRWKDEERVSRLPRGTPGSAPGMLPDPVP